MRLNWFSPLPPAQAKVADYTAHLLSALCHRSEVVLWTDQAEWDPRVEQQARVCRYHKGQVPWRELNRADMTIYHLGNNPDCHGSAWQISQQHPGIVVLHDITLPDLFTSNYQGRQRQRGDFKELSSDPSWLDSVASKMLTAESRIPGSIEGRRGSSPPLTQFGGGGSLGILVHTRSVYEELRREQSCPLAYQPLSYPTRGASWGNGAGSRESAAGSAPRILERHHTPERYVEAVIRLVELAQKYRPRCLAAYLAERVAEGMSTWMNPRAEDSAYQRVAQEIHQLVC